MCIHHSSWPNHKYLDKTSRVHNIAARNADAYARLAWLGAVMVGKCKSKIKYQAVNFFLFVGQPTNIGGEISLFIGGDSVPFRPSHGRLHQSPRIDEDTDEQWPCCGPIKKVWGSGTSA